MICRVFGVGARRRRRLAAASAVTFFITGESGAADAQEREECMDLAFSSLCGVLADARRHCRSS